MASKQKKKELDAVDVIATTINSYGYMPGDEERILDKLFATRKNGKIRKLISNDIPQGDEKDEPAGAATG